MKMKEKKTEEVVEEVVETPKISDELREYLEFVRQCEYQHAIFEGSSEEYLKEVDRVLGTMIDISKPVSVLNGFAKENIFREYEDFIQLWIDRFNELDLEKFDNFTVLILRRFTPNIFTTYRLKEKFKKCAQHTTEE